MQPQYWSVTFFSLQKLHLHCSKPLQHWANKRIQLEPLTKMAGKETQVESVVQMCVNSHSGLSFCHNGLAGSQFVLL